MPTYGGADTTNLANADASGRQQVLKARMDAAEQTNKQNASTQQNITQGLGTAQQAVMQTDQAEKSRQLEAARSGLEYSTDKKGYVPSAAAAEEKAQVRKDVGIQQSQGQQKIDIEKSKVEGETGLKQQEAATQMANAKVSAMREGRLAEEQSVKTAQEKAEWRFKQDSATDNRIEEITKMQIGLELGDQKAHSEAINMLSGNPQYKQVLEEIKSGNASPEGIQQVRSALNEAKNAAAISGAAQNGYISMMADPTSPTMQRFYQTRQIHQTILENDMNREFQYLQMLPQEEQGNAKKYLTYTRMSQEDRVRFVNQQSALSFQGIETGRILGANSGGGSGYSQGGGGQGGGSSAGPGGGGGQPSKLGGASQRPQPRISPVGPNSEYR